MSHPSPRLRQILRLSGRVSLELEPLTQQMFSARAHDESVEIFRTYPDRLFFALAHISAMSQSESEETLRESLIDVARHLGADAVVLGQAYAIETTRPSPPYQSTVDPFNASSNPSAWDARSVTQGVADQSEWTLQVSGMAIRYESSNDYDPVASL